MTPIVLAASCMPWPSDIAAADTDCACRKPRETRDGLAFRKIQRMATITK